MLTSLEPALSLELLLLNMAYLPRLLPLQNLASCAVSPGGQSPAPTGMPGPSGPAGPAGQRPASSPARPTSQRFDAPSPRPSSPSAPSRQPDPAAEPGPGVADRLAPAPTAPRTWEAFKRFAAKGGEIAGLKKARGVFAPTPEPGELHIGCENAFHCGQLTQPEKFRQLQALVAEYFGQGVAVRVETASGNGDRMSPEDLRQYVDDRPEVRQAMSTFDAEIIERKPR